MIRHVVTYKGYKGIPPNNYHEVRNLRKQYWIPAVQIWTRNENLHGQYTYI